MLTSLLSALLMFSFASVRADSGPFTKTFSGCKEYLMLHSLQHFFMLADVHFRGDMYIVAHVDDDLIFQSPDLLNSIRKSIKDASFCTTTLILTAGDAGLPMDYTVARENGSDAAYGYMIGPTSRNVNDYLSRFSQTFVSETWPKYPGVTSGCIIHAHKTRKNIRKCHFRLPDGGDTGAGFSSTNFNSLRKLWDGTLPDSAPKLNNTVEIAAVDGKTGKWTLATLSLFLADMINDSKANTVRVQDWTKAETGVAAVDEHSDHVVAAKLGRVAVQLVNEDLNGTREVKILRSVHALLAITTPQLLTAQHSYLDYDAVNLSVNLPDTDPNFQTKSNAFFAYASFDNQLVSSCC